MHSIKKQILATFIYPQTTEVKAQYSVLSVNKIMKNEMAVVNNFTRDIHFFILA